MKLSCKPVLGGLLLLALLSGCASKESVPAAGLEAPKASEPAKTAEESNPQGKPNLQNRKERQLVILFLALLQMDRTTGLAISSDQAGNLLPLIQKSKDEGQITPEDQNRVIELLTADQKTFYEELSGKMSNKTQLGPPRNLDNLSQEEREKLIEEFKKRRAEIREGDTAAPRGPRGNARPGGDSNTAGAGMGPSMEQQLIDLLTSKLKAQ